MKENSMLPYDSWESRNRTSAPLAAPKSAERVTAEKLGVRIPNFPKPPAPLIYIPIQTADGIRLVPATAAPVQNTTQPPASALVEAVKESETVQT